MTEASATRMDNIKEWVYDHRRPLMAGFAALAVIILLIGLSLMWFVNNKSLSTVGKIQAPAKLKVLGPNQSAIEQIDISYSEAMKDSIGSDGDGTATIRRGFCVQSDGSDFELQIANTTNISGLKIKVYRVANNNQTEASKVTIAGVSGTTTYAWTKADSPIEGFELINPYKAGDESLAKDLETTDDPTFENYKKVQKNARPLYRCKKFSGESELYQAGDVKGVATNFIIECTWKTRPNVKETDVVYLIARSTK